MKRMKTLTDLFFYRFLSSCLICLFAINGLSAQFTVEVTVLSGGASTTCTDSGLFGDTPGEPMWGVSIQNEPVEFYDNLCQNLTSYPNNSYVQYTEVVDCLSDLNGGEIFVVFWAFDNDPLGLFPDRCDLTTDNDGKGCLATPGQNFGLPRPGTDSVYNFNPVDPSLDSGGFVRFRISVSEDASNRAFATNDRICLAQDLGTLSQGIILGDTTQGNYSNFCATNLLEPDPAADGGTWTNDAGTWFAFTTSNSTGSVQVAAKSDPDGTGNPINLQLALYESDNGACDGNLQLIKDQFVGGELDESLTIECLSPNTTYYLLVDGEITTNGSPFGQFGLQINELDILPLTNDDICDAIELEVSTGSNNVGKYSNNCATSNNDPNTIAGLNITNSVWFKFVPNASRSVFINIDSDQDDPIEPEMTVFYAPSNNCSDNLEEVPSQRAAGGVSSVFYTLECLNTKSTYYILVDGTDADPTGTFSIITAEGPYPAPISLDTIICRGDIFDIGNSSYANSGTYQDTIINNDDCIEIIETNLSVVNPVELKLDVGQLARGEGMPGGAMVANVQFGTGSYEYMWSTGSTGPVANNLIGGNQYCVTVTDRGAGCGVDTCFIMPFPIPTLAQITNDTVACSSDLIGQIQIEIIEGRPPYQYQVRGIDDPSFISIGVIAKNDTLITLVDIPVGSYNIATIDSDNLPNSFPANVSAPDPIAINLVEEIAATCFQTCNGSIEVSASGGQGTLNFEWGEDMMATNNLTNICAGNYTVTVTDENQCQDSMQFTILEPRAPNIGFFNITPVACFGEENGTATLTINEAINSILWDNGEMTESVTNLNAGIHKIFITSENGCEYVDSVNITQPDAPLTATIEVTETIACGGDANGVLTDATTGGNGNYEYIWNNGETNDFIDNLPAGTYELIVRDAKGCVSDTMVTLDEPTPIDAQIITQDVTCPGGANSGIIQIDNPTGGSMPYRYAVDNQNFISNPEITNLQAGTYALLMQDDNGCEKVFDNLIISEPPALTVDLGGDREIKLGTSIDLNADVAGNVTYEWFSTDSLSCLDCSTVTAKPSNTANYTVRVTGIRTGCIAEDEITIAVSKARELYVPNVFSPNGDGINDELSLLGGLDIDRVLQFEIYSRDGARVFKRDNFDLNEGIFWDGSYNGQNLSTDVFIYFAEIEFIDGAKEIFRGDFTLVR